MRAGDLTIVIPTRSRWAILKRTLAALAAQTEQGFETVVVVDGADQEVPPQLERTHGVRVLLTERVGPGAARNLGTRQTERPLLLFLGDDMIPLPALVERHLARHRAEPAPEVAVLGHIDWHPEIARDRLLHWLDWSGSQFDYMALAPKRGEDVGFGRFYSSNVSLKRQLFLDAGGFDPEFEREYEDLDLGWRLHQRGLRLIYEPDAIAHHLHRYDWAEVQRRYARRAEAERLMSAKHSWFSPWFYERIRAHMAQSRASRLWPLVVDYVPSRPGRLRRAVEARANRWYHQQLAPWYMRAWNDAEDGRSKPPG